MRTFSILAAALIASVPAALALYQETPAYDERWLPPHALSCGAPTLDVSDYELVGFSRDGTPHPDIPEDWDALTFTYDQWKCIYPSESAEVQRDEGVFEPGEELVHGPHGSHPAGPIGALNHEGAPKTGGSLGWLKVTVLYPLSYQYNAPSGGCNLNDVEQAMSWIHSQVGGGTHYTWCYQWQYAQVYSNDYLAVLNGFHSNVHEFWSTLVDGPNEIALGVYGSMNHNGVTWENSKISVFAEQCSPNCVNLYDDSVIMHEFSHNFGANHVGLNGNPNVCWGTVSVMNYCWIASSHANKYDSGNLNKVSNQYWAP